MQLPHSFIKPTKAYITSAIIQKLFSILVACLGRFSLVRRGIATRWLTPISLENLKKNRVMRLWCLNENYAADDDSLSAPSNYTTIFYWIKLMRIVESTKGAAPGNSCR